MLNVDDWPILTGMMTRYDISDAAFVRHMLEKMEPQSLQRGEILVGAGSPFNAFYIIAEGVVRYYYSADNGRERNKAFYKEGHFIGSLSAYLTQRIMPFDIQALERCRLYRIPLSWMDELEGENRAELSRVVNAAARELFVRNEQREAVLLTRDAEQRYAWMLANESWLLQRVSQYHLASYLGMDPVSLSRLKKKSV